MPAPVVTKSEIMKGLRQLGLTPGMRLMVHSSLSSFGYVEGGAHAVVEALMELLTPEGTLLMPTFNHGAPFGDGGLEYYHPEETPTINGAIPDRFWRTDGVARSLNPTHPFAAWGRDHRRYTENHHRTLTMGPESPLGLLHRDDGYCLLLGVDYRSNTFHHVVETSTGAPCLGRRTEAYPVVLPDGRRVLGRTWGWRARSCPFTDSNRYADEMVDKQRVAVIGRCRALLYRLRDCYSVVARILAQGKQGFPPCDGCPIRPRRVPQTVPSDWDEARQCLKPDSVALTY
ncbi:MAG: AAC(3) family N-acetyltransferase [Anaerolineae bacterium]